MENTIRKNRTMKIMAMILSMIMFVVSSSVSTIPAYASVAKTTITSVTATVGGFKVSYKKVSGVDGYQVQYATNKEFTKNKKSVSYTAKSDSTSEYDGLKSNTKYYVRVRSFKISSNKFVYSSWSSVKNVTTKKLNKTTTLKSVTESNPAFSSTSLKVTWKKVSGVTGYQVQYATNKKFTKNKKTVTIKGATVSSKSIKGNANTKYYVRVRAYKTSGGKTYYSAWSSVKSATTNANALAVVKDLGIKDSMSDLEKVARVQDWIDHNWYYTGSKANDIKNNIFETNKGVCVHFAYAFEKLMTAAGVKCFYVEGSNHAWNIVEIDGYWYNYNSASYVDLLWDGSYDATDKENLEYEMFIDYPSYSSRMNSSSLKKWKACSPQADVDKVKETRELFGDYLIQLHKGEI